MTTANEVRAFYEQSLGRTPSQSEIDYWVNTGLSATTVGQRIDSSREATVRRETQSRSTPTWTPPPPSEPDEWGSSAENNFSGTGQVNLVDGTLVDPSTGRPVFTGPNGEGGRATPAPGYQPFTMPDGRVAYYRPGENIQAGNQAALGLNPTATNMAPGANPAALNAWIQANTPGVDPATRAQRQDAFAVVQGILRQYGLEELSDWARSLIVNGASEAQVQVELYEQPAFRQRFRAIFARQERGLPPISPEEVMAYERQRAQVMRMYGFPEGFYDDPDDAVAGLVEDVSINEVEQRAAMWVDFARNQAPEVRLELQRLYGVTDGALAAYMMDPDRALPLIQRQANAALVGFAAQRNNFGFLTADEAERFGELGISSEQAAQRFGVLGRLGEVLGERVGDQQQALSREGVLGAAYGDASAVDEVERRQRRAQAEFEQGGGFAGSSSGLGGLGTAQ